MQKNRSARTVAAGAALAAAWAVPAAAQDFWGSAPMAPYEETFTFDLGGIVNRFDSSVRIDGEGRRGTQIDLEGNGLERNLTSFQAAMTWRIARRHRLDLEYYEADRSGSRSYSNSITIGDETFPVGASVDLDARTRFANLGYRYSFVQRPDFEAAVLVGLFGGKVTYDIEAVGISGAVQRTYNVTRTTSIPVPLLGASMDWYLDRRWKLGARLQGFAAEVGDVDAKAFLASATLEYMLGRNFGIGARYAYADVEADVKKSGFLGNVNWTSNSVSLYGKFVF